MTASARKTLVHISPKKMVHGLSKTVGAKDGVTTVIFGCPMRIKPYMITSIFSQLAMPLTMKTYICMTVADIRQVYLLRQLQTYLLQMKTFTLQK